jgi:monovalent cation:H+ antiporter-2, CPA2 family
MSNTKADQRLTFAPVVLRYNERAARYLSDRATRRTEPEQVIAKEVYPLTGHVIICGYGATGRNVARQLKVQHIPFVALDHDIAQVRGGLDAGERVLYGDAGNGTLLRAAGVKHAGALVVSFENERHAHRVVQTARAERHDLPILVRARDESTLKRLLKTGATEGVPGTLEVSIVLTMQLLLVLGMASSDVFEAINTARGERY